HPRLALPPTPPPPYPTLFRPTRFRRSASRFEYAITRSCRVNSTALAMTAKTSSGATARYKLMPQARMTTSSLFLVIRPTVTRVRSEEHTSELQSRVDVVRRLL